MENPALTAKLSHMHTEALSKLKQ